MNALLHTTYALQGDAIGHAGIEPPAALDAAIAAVGELQKEYEAASHAASAAYAAHQLVAQDHPEPTNDELFKAQAAVPVPEILRQNRPRYAKALIFALADGTEGREDLDGFAFDTLNHIDKIEAVYAGDEAQIAEASKALNTWWKARERARMALLKPAREVPAVKDAYEAWTKAARSRSTAQRGRDLALKALCDLPVTTAEQKRRKVGALLRPFDCKITKAGYVDNFEAVWDYERDLARRILKALIEEPARCGFSEAAVEC